MNKRYLDCILAELEEGCQRRYKRFCCDFVIKNGPKMISILPFAKKFKDLLKCVCISVCKGEFYGNLWGNILSVFFQKNADVSSFVKIQRSLSRKIARLTLSFFVDSNSPCRDLLFPPGPNLAQKPSYLVGTVLKSRFDTKPYLISLGLPTLKKNVWKK